MSNLILHIPHASSQIPNLEGFILSQAEINSEIKLLTDWYTDELFRCEQATTVKAGFSRLFCDVERFADDSLEVMASYGMGVLYTHTDDGRRLREVTPDLRNRILKLFYTPHHQKLECIVETALNSSGEALIVDCHSFPDMPFKRDLNQKMNRPDINIATDEFHTSVELLTKTKNFSLRTA